MSDRIRSKAKQSHSRNRAYKKFPTLRHPHISAGVKKSISKLIKILFTLSFLLLLIPTIWYGNQTVQLAFFSPSLKIAERPSPSLSHSNPTRIRITKIGIDSPIEETKINNKVWEISQKGISHLAISARPGEQGPIILYGHNTNDRFGPIRWLTKGDDIEVLAGSQKYNYIVVQTMRVRPDQMDIFTQQIGERLTLYTCDGFGDLERFLVIAERSK